MDLLQPKQSRVSTVAQALEIFRGKLDAEELATSIEGIVRAEGAGKPAVVISCTIRTDVKSGQLCAVIRGEKRETLSDMAFYGLEL